MCFSAACVAASMPRTLIVDHAIHLLQRGLLERFWNGSAGIVDKHIQSAEPSDRCSTALLQLRRRRRSALDCESLSAIAFNRF